MIDFINDQECVFSPYKLFQPIFKDVFALFITFSQNPK